MTSKVGLPGVALLTNKIGGVDERIRETLQEIGEVERLDSLKRTVEWMERGRGILIAPLQYLMPVTESYEEFRMPAAHDTEGVSLPQAIRHRYESPVIGGVIFREVLKGNHGILPMALYGEERRVVPLTLEEDLPSDLSLLIKHMTGMQAISPREGGSPRSHTRLPRGGDYLFQCTAELIEQGMRREPRKPVPWGRAYSGRA